MCKIHRELKAGNILVFVTGQKEVNDLCRKLACTFPSSVAPREDGERESGVEGEAVLKRKRKKEQDIDLDKYVKYCTRSASVIVNRCTLYLCVRT